MDQLSQMRSREVWERTATPESTIEWLKQLGM